MAELLISIERVLWFIVWLVGVILSYRVVFNILGVCLPAKKFKDTDKRYKYAVLIPARNEEQTIAQLIDSIKKQDYPQDLISIFVIAHNCTDNTAVVAREAGAIVYEYNNNKQRRKGYAIDYLLSQIRNDYVSENQPNGILTFDGYFLFDADNLLAADFVTQMNKVFDDRKFDGVVGYINMKNFGSSIIASYSSINLYEVTVLGYRPFACLGLTPGMRGTGIVMRNHLLENGYKYFSLCEDTEFSVTLVSKGYRTTYCEAAVHFDEQPLSFRIIARQNMRAVRGNTVVFFKKAPALALGIFAPYDFKKLKKKNVGTDVVGESFETSAKNNFWQKSLVEFQKRFSCFDRLITSIPLWIFSFLFGFLYPLAVLIVSTFTDNVTNIATMFEIVITYYTTFYTTHFIYNLAAIVREHRKMRINHTKLFIHMFFWPFIAIALTYVQIVGVFWPVKWKPIPHVDNKYIEDIYKEPTLAEFR